MSRAPKQKSLFAMTFIRRPQRALLAGAAAMIAVLAGSGLAMAETAVTIFSDQARVLTVKGKPAVAIVGNPLYADASIREGMIVLQGRHFGTTNLVVIDADGNELANFVVTVQQTPTSRVTVYNGSGAYTYTCADNNCETTLEVGDELTHFKAIQVQMDDKNKLANGSSPAPTN